MKLLKKILLPVNPEFIIEKSIPFAIELAKEYNSKIVLLYILSSDHDEKEFKEVYLNSVNEELNKIATRIKQNGVDIEGPIIQYGNIFDRIVYVAENKNVNAILFGEEQIRNNYRSFLNTNIEKVIRLSNKPVWTTLVREYHKIKKIVCPVDFSKASRRALANAINIAESLGAEIIIISVMKKLRPPYALDKQPTKTEVKLKDKFSNDLNQFVSEFSFKDVKYSKLLLEGDPKLIISKFLEEEQPDLLIMGSTGRTGIGRLFIGSVTENVIRNVPCSFIVTKSEDVVSTRLEAKINSLKLHYDKAQEYYNKKMYEEAIGEYFSALSFNDMHIHSWYGIAKIYEKMGNLEKAEECENIAKGIVKKLINSNR